MHVAVLDKAFLLLERLAREDEPVSLARLTGMTGLPKPTVFRILQTLIDLGYLAQDGRAKYHLTNKLDILSQSNRFREIKSRALGAMHKLHRQFNETVNLGVLDGMSIRYIHVLETTRPLRIMARPNVVDEFYSTAIGRAIVSNLPKVEQDSLVKAATLRAITPKTVKTKERLRQVLEESAERGWAIDDEETVQGVICFGTALTDDGYPVAGMSVTMPRTRLTKELREAIVAALLSVKA